MEAATTISYPKEEVEEIKKKALGVVSKTEKFFVTGEGGERRIVIKSAEGAQELAEYSKELRVCQKGIEGKIRPGIKMADDLHKWLLSLLKEAIGPFSIREEICDRALLAWKQDQDRIVRETAAAAEKIAEEERKKKEAAERARVESERLDLAARLEEEGFGEEAQAVIERPIEVNVPIETPAPVAAPAKIGGISSSVRYYADIIDPALLIAHVHTTGQIGLIFQRAKDGVTFEFNTGAIDKMATSQKEELRIPGVKVRKEEGLRKRTS